MAKLSARPIQLASYSKLNLPMSSTVTLPTKRRSK